MRRSAEDLQRQRRIHAVHAFFQKPNVLIFCLANSAKGGSETHANARLRIFRRIGEASVIESELRRRDGELRVTIETFQSMRRKKIFRRPVTNFSSATRVKAARVESRDGNDATFFRANIVPEIFASASDASDRSEPGNDRAPAGAVARMFCRSSLSSAFQIRFHAAQGFVRDIMNEEIADDRFDDRRKRRDAKCRSCKISTSTPAGVSLNVQTTRIPFVHAFR